MALPHLSWPTLAVGVGTIAVLVLIEHFRPRWPAPLIAVAGAIAGAGLLGVAESRRRTRRRDPERIAAADAAGPVAGAAAVARRGGYRADEFHRDHCGGSRVPANDEPAPRPNVELLATGIANVGGALFGSMPGGGGTSQTAVNRMTGARTQMAGVVTASMTVVTMLLLAPLIGLMPQATLAAVVIVYSIGLIQPADFRDILRIRRTEFVWAIAAFAGVMLLGTLEGILVAIIVSVVALSQQTANPPVYVLGRKRGTNVFRPRSDEHPDRRVVPGVLLLRLEGRLFFLNADAVAREDPAARSRSPSRRSWCWTCPACSTSNIRR